MVDSKTYSEEEVEHLVARQVAAHDIAHMRSAISSMVENFAKIDASIGSIYEKLDAKFTEMHDDIGHCRDDLRKEIERDFVTKPEFITRMNTVENKVDKQWIKITTAVSVAGMVIGVLAKMTGLL